MKTEDLLKIQGRFTDLGMFKSSRQYIITTPLAFEKIRETYDRLLSNEEFKYNEPKYYKKGPNAQYLITGPNTGNGYNHRWQIDILRADDKIAVDDMTCYLGISKEFPNYIDRANLYFIVVFDNEEPVE